MPGLRRLRRAQCRAECAAAAGHPQGKVCVCQRHRLLQPLPVLSRHLRVPLHPRPRAHHRHRREGGQPRAFRLGHHRRRRRAEHRRQPSGPRPAPQPRHQHHPAQQQDLRADQGAVQPHFRSGENHQDQPLRRDRRAAQPPARRARLRGLVRGARGRHRSAAHRRGAAGGGPPSGNLVRRDPAKLRHLQPRRLEGNLRPRHPQGPFALPRTGQATGVRRAGQQGHSRHLHLAQGGYPGRTGRHQKGSGQARHVPQGRRLCHHALGDDLPGIPGSRRHLPRGKAAGLRAGTGGADPGGYGAEGAAQPPGAAARQRILDRFQWREGTQALRRYRRDCLRGVEGDGRAGPRAAQVHRPAYGEPENHHREDLLRLRLQARQDALPARQHIEGDRQLYGQPHRMHPGGRREAPLRHPLRARHHPECGAHLHRPRPPADLGHHAAGL